MEILQVPAELSKFSAMSHRSLRIVFDTQENLTDEQVSKITSNHERTGWLAFLVSEKNIQIEDIKDLPEIESDSYKTPSQRQRAVLYRIWEHQGKGKSFEEFYLIMMDKIANWLKEKYLN